MIDKAILKHIIKDCRLEIESYRIVHREARTDGFDCCIFVGVRRAGKSFILYERMQEMLRCGHSWNDMLYFNFEDDRLTDLGLEDMDRILEAHLEMGGNPKPMVFLDKIQNVDGWEKFARRLADNKYKVWITGSNAKMLSMEMMSTLGGRYLPVEVYPFSFREYLNAVNVPHDENTLLGTVGRSNVLRAFEEYFNWGGLPESIPLTVKRNYLSSVYQKIYLGDVCARNRISSPNLLRLMLRKMSESVKQPVSYTRIAKILLSVSGRITVPTVASHIGYCEDAWLLLRLRNVCSSFTEKESNCKYYFIDNGLISLQLLDPATTLLENLVAVELFRRYGKDPDNERVFFYNDNIEVDFYIPDETLAIQVSYSISEETAYDREVGALRKLPKVKDCGRRLIITYDQKQIIEDEYGKIEVVPCWEWLLSDESFA